MEHSDWLINNRNNKNQSDAATHGTFNMMGSWYKQPVSSVSRVAVIIRVPLILTAN